MFSNFYINCIHRLIFTLIAFSYVCCCIPVRAHYIYLPDASGDDKPLKDGAGNFAKIRPVIDNSTLFKNLVLGQHRWVDCTKLKTLKVHYTVLYFTVPLH